MGQPLTDTDIAGAIAELARRQQLTDDIIDSLVELSDLDHGDDPAALSAQDQEDEILRLSVSAPELFERPEVARLYGPRRPAQEAAAARAATPRRFRSRESRHADAELMRLTANPRHSRFFDQDDILALSVVGGVAVSQAAAQRAGYDPETLATALAGGQAPSRSRRRRSGDPSGSGPDRKSVV